MYVHRRVKRLKTNDDLDENDDAKWSTEDTKNIPQSTDVA